MKIYRKLAVLLISLTLVVSFYGVSFAASADDTNGASKVSSYDDYEGDDYYDDEYDDDDGYYDDEYDYDDDSDFDDEDEDIEKPYEPIKASSCDISITYGESKTVYITAKYVKELACDVDGDQVKCTIGAKSGDAFPLTIKGLKGGYTDIEVYDKDDYDNSTTISVTVASKPIKATTKNLTLGYDKSKSITITAEGCEDIWYDIIESKPAYEYAEDDVVSCTWGKWNGNKITLKITANLYGTAKVKVYDGNNTDNYVIIKVTAFDKYCYSNLSKYSYTYNGKSHKPSVSIYNSNSKKISSKNYKLKYDSKTSTIGTHKVKVIDKSTGKCKFTLSYEVVPKATSITSLKASGTSVKVKWKKQASQTSGYYIYWHNSDYTDTGSKCVKGNKNTSNTIKGLQYGKKYSFYVSAYKVVKGKKYYSNYSKEKTVKIPQMSNTTAKKKIAGKLYREIKKKSYNPSEVVIKKSWVGLSDTSVFTDNSKRKCIVMKYEYYGIVYYAIGWLNDDKSFSCTTNWNGNEYYLTSRKSFDYRNYI